MKPNEYAQIAQQLRMLATNLKPDATNPCANLLNEATVYMNMAATKIQAVAEHTAGKEKASAAK